MTKGDAAYYAETLTDLQRRAIELCSETATFGYSRLGEKLGISYQEAQDIGHFFQSANLAQIKLLKPGYNGSGIFLNERGEQVKIAVLALAKRNEAR